MGSLSLPRVGDIKGVPLVFLGDLGDTGPYHLDIRGAAPRGPFDNVKLDPKTGDDWRSASYPMLWAHDFEREIRLIVEPDQQGRIRPGMQSKAKKIWKSASRLHFNQEFQLNSQSLAACLTPEPCIGGRAWPTVSLDIDDERHEMLLVLWANSTLGLIAFWWIGSRQQRGRANLTLTRLPDLRVIDPSKLSDVQLQLVPRIFSDVADKKFLPANEAYRDETRQALDKAILVDLLDLPSSNSGLTEADLLDAVDVLRRQWCSEPSVHGGKKTRP